VTRSPDTEQSGTHAITSLSAYAADLERRARELLKLAREWRREVRR